jgi:hypothetical protein
MEKSLRMIPLLVQKYLASRGSPGIWKISETAITAFDGAIVIPSLAESKLLFSTLHSLAQNPTDILSRFLVLVVVNHRQDASASDKRDNLRTLARLTAGDPSLEHLQLGWVDAASPGQELPPKIGGVGLARKIGFDLALARIDYRQGPGILISLDADTLCRSDYLPAITRHFRNSRVCGAVIPFCHQDGATPAVDRAIRRYELFLRTYVLGLDRAGSPYAFHTVGSAMACSAEAYVRAGGMKVRAAGEDFYFLEHLAKEGGVSKVNGTVVYPSARSSHRVPFGTGRSMSRLLADDEGAVLFYQAKCFQVLKEWLDLVHRSLDSDADSIQERAEKISCYLANYLTLIKFNIYWMKLRNNFTSRPLLRKGFHAWFDGLKTMKLIHHLSAGPFPRQEPEQAVPGLFRWAALEPVEGLEGQLSLLRERQIGEAY